MSYSLKENVRLLVSLLKSYEIKYIVLSSGNRNIPFVQLVESDEYFTCYSIVDERSAGFFALGLMERLQCPVAICCTSGTAICNYTSAVAEAYYQKLPLVVITADRPAYFLNQNEDQMVPQVELLSSVTKCSVQLPAIATNLDYWYCANRIHAALLELDHHGKGPVHINVQIDDKATNVSDALYEKPDTISRLHRYEIGELRQNMWEERIDDLVSSRIMIVYGQNGRATQEEISLLNTFTALYDCVIVKDHLANIQCDNIVPLYAALNILSDAELDKLFPDIIISLHGNSILYQPLKGAVAKRVKQVSQWLVSDDGEVKDSLRCLREIFECTAQEFLHYFAQTVGSKEHTFAKEWKSYTENLSIPQPAFSSLYAVKRLMEDIPDNSVLHIANSSSVRYANMFPLKETVSVYCNRGTNGIDGSFSSFIGNAVVSDELCFLLIGDLSFFYDMNACWNRYCGKNLRILLNNNEGAELFHYSYGTKLSGINRHIAAEHDASAKGWMESRGFCYLRANNEEEFETAFTKFLDSDTDQPILLEVCTHKDEDAKVVHDYYECNRSLSLKHETKKIVKKIMGKSKSLDVAINKARNKF